MPEAGLRQDASAPFSANLVEPAAANNGISMQKRPINIAKPMVKLYQGVFGLMPPNPLPLLPVPLVYA